VRVRPRLLRRVLIVGLVGAVLAAGGLVVVALIGDDGPDHPNAWDERVVDLVRFVERERGLDFEHPVHVDFLATKDFEDKVTTDEADLTDEEREDLEIGTQLLSALGFVEPGTDLFEELNTLSAGNTAAFYDPDEQRVSVRGTSLTTDVRGTLVHELTHALQDQHFDLSRYDDDEDRPSGVYSAWTALVEGDATRIENAWAQRLDEDDFADYQRGAGDAADEAGAAIADVPEILTALFSAPYALGEGLLLALDGDGGNARIDEAFEDPPATEEHLLDPWAFLDGEDPVDVTAPSVPTGEDHRDTDDFGAVGWYLTLAERIEPGQALEAALGWGGDAAVLSTKGGRACVRATFAGDTGQDVDEMEAALRAWVAALPPEAAAVERKGDRVTLRSCEPEDPAPVAGRSEEALTLAAFRVGLAAGLAQEGGSRRIAECVADGVIGRIGIDRLDVLEAAFADTSGSVPPAMIELLRPAFADCGLPDPFPSG